MPRHTYLLILFLGLTFGMLAPQGWSEETNKDEVAKPAAAPRVNTDADYELFKTLVDVMDQVERNYVQEVSRKELMEAAIRGVMQKLDPHSNYIDADHVDQFRTNIDNEFGGIGIVVGLRNGRITVISPIVGSPAYRAGVQAGDQIIRIEGESTKGYTLIDATGKLKGKAGTKVGFTILRPRNNETKDISVRREVVQIESVLGDVRNEDDSWDFMVDHENKIGYIRMTAFSRDTTRVLRRAMEELKAAGMRGLVLDLRFNPGGLLTAAVETCDMFIPEGKIVSTEDRAGRERKWEAKKRGTFDGFPMAILINRGSASASEIVAGCLQDHKRAMIVGERSFGKGSVQNVVNLPGGGALKLTTATYFRPSGKNIHRHEDSKPTDDWGVTPNDGYRMRLSDDELENLIIYRRDRDIVLAHVEDDAPVAAPAPEETAPAAGNATFEDRQFKKAMEYVLSQLDKDKTAKAD